MKLFLIISENFAILPNTRLLPNTKLSLKADQVLKQTIQVLLRLRELPIGLVTEITGYELKRVWDDLGFNAINS